MNSNIEAKGKKDKFVVKNTILQEVGSKVEKKEVETALHKIFSKYS